MKRTTLITMAGMITGIVLFVAAGVFVRLPIGFAGERIPFEYAILGFFAALLGPLPGMGAGFFGMLFMGIFLSDLWWSEVLATLFMGSIIGLCQRTLSIGDGGFESRGLVTYAGFTAAASVLCWILMAPAFDTLIYKIEFGATFLYWLSHGAAVIIAAVAGGGLLCLAAGMLFVKKPLFKQGI